MKKTIIQLLLLTALIGSGFAQQSQLIGHWQLKEVVQGDEVYEDLEAVFIFEEGGILKAAKSVDSDAFEVGSWKYNSRKNTLVMSSSLDDDFEGKATVLECSNTELIYKKEDAYMHFSRLSTTGLEQAGESPGTTGEISRLDFTEADFFNEDGDYKYYEDEGKLPWKDPYEMLVSLEKVTQLVYKFSKLNEDLGAFEDKILRAEVDSRPEEGSLLIDYIFYGYDRYNLPEDSQLPPNNDFANLLYPEEDGSFRVTGSEQITTPAGTFDCTVLELAGSFEAMKKLWMINNMPGIYARIIMDKPGAFGQYAVFELEEIIMEE